MIFFKSKSAFTLVEIMLVVIIISALAAMIVPRLSGRSEQAKAAVAKADIQGNIATALKLYELDNGTFPTTAQGLAALRERPTTSPLPKSWIGPYLEKDAIDPWGNVYVYSSPGTHRTDYDLNSKGKDPDSAQDDVNNWQ